MDERLDPIQIIARPGPAVAGYREQVFGVWLHVARKAGWHVEPVDAEVDWPAGECGVVDVEGLRYLIRVGQRSRGVALIVPDEHVGVHVADVLTGRRSYPTEPIFTLTVWAEPILS